MAMENASDKGVVALLVEPFSPPRLVRVDGWEEMCSLMGCDTLDAAFAGHFPSCPTAAIYCDDEGKINGAMPNRGLYDHAGVYDPSCHQPALMSDDPLVDIIHGAFLVVNSDPETGEDVDLPLDAAREIARELSCPLTGPVEAADIASSRYPGLDAKAEYRLRLGASGYELSAKYSSKTLANLWPDLDREAIKRIVPSFPAKVSVASAQLSGHQANVLDVFDWAAEESASRGVISLGDPLLTNGDDKNDSWEFEYRGHRYIPAALFTDERAARYAHAKGELLLRTRDDEFSLPDFLTCTGGARGAGADLFFVGGLDRTVVCPTQEGLLVMDEAMRQAASRRLSWGSPLLAAFVHLEDPGHDTLVAHELDSKPEVLKWFRSKGEDTPHITPAPRAHL
jgi:hypothetical protein